MLNIYLFFYKIAIFAYGFVLYLASFLNLKAKKWIKGRVNWQNNLKTQLKALHDNRNNTKPLLWLHVASLGEYEQGKILVEKLKKENNYLVLVSFFSPSGYEIINNNNSNSNNIADLIVYLPLDTAKNAAEFLEIANPKLIVWVKYELWYFYIQKAAELKINIILIAVIFHKKHLIFSWIGKLQWKTINYFNQIFVQDQNSILQVQQFMNKQHSSPFYQQNNFINKLQLGGDSRIDSILQSQQSAVNQNFEYINAFCGTNKILIIGSGYLLDLEFLVKILTELVTQNWKIIVVPHQVEIQNINKITNFLAKQKIFSTLIYSDLLANNQLTNNANLLIINKIGILKYIYKYANFAYIGGGLGAGLHNVLEAAVYKIPVAFAGKLHKFTELTNLININAAYWTEKNSVLQQQLLLKFILESQTEIKLVKIQANLKLFFDLHSGATVRMLEVFLYHD